VHLHLQSFALSTSLICDVRQPRDNKQNFAIMTNNIKFVAELSNVTEVSLLGTANLDYWQKRLSPYGLFPLPSNGTALILVIAAKAHFMRVPFCEVSFSVIVSPNQDQHSFQDGACLLSAFNSNRFFAFSERTFFSTPYYPAKCEIGLSPTKIKLSNRRETLFTAQMGNVENRETLQLADDGWHGSVAILPPGRNANTPYKYFIAKINGKTSIYPFEASNDTLIVAKDSSHPLFSELAESGFDGKQWIVRPAANHAKSKTYRSVNLHNNACSRSGSGA